jgi:hypothetical protein
MGIAVPARSEATGVLVGVIMLIGVVTLTGCASGRTDDTPPRDVIATLPGRAPADMVPDSVLRALVEPGPTLRRGFTEDDCACTLEHRINLCVTVNGALSFSDNVRGLAFAREREHGKADTLSRAEVAAGARCFGEWAGVQRVLMLRDSAVVDSTGWFEVPTVDCCHGEAKTVDFKQAN